MAPEQPTPTPTPTPTPASTVERVTGTVNPARIRALLQWDAALVVALAAVFALGIAISPQFLTSYNIFSMCTNIGDLAIMALPMTLIIITGEIDLSVASILALSAELMGYLWLHHWSMPAIFAVVLLVGVVCGLINGLLITRAGLPSLAVTIGTLTLYRGLADVVLGPTSVSSFPATYTNVGVVGFAGISWLSWSVAIFVVLAIATGIVLRMTGLGRSLYAIGLNQEAAFHAGIRVKRIKLSLFVVSGLVCSAVGMLYAFELSSAAENIGIGFELQVVTIVLLGGVSIFGGRGSILGVAMAALVYGLLRSGLLLTSTFNENDFQVISGGLLILSVLIPNVGAFATRGRELVGRYRSRTLLNEEARTAGGSLQDG